MISMITGIFIYLVALAFGLDFAIFWWFLAFILNFIPNIGAIIAVIIPTIISFVQPWFTPYDTLFMALCMTWVQVLGWNIIEPQFMWNRLNLSPLVIIISLAFWWIIWWVVWMLLSVPIMVIINIILSKIPATRPIAILLSEKWDLQVESEDVEKRRKRLIKSLKDKFEGIKRK
jgi:predicted PurR-regulated permease PerM